MLEVVAKVPMRNKKKRSEKENYWSNHSFNSWNKVHLERKLSNEISRIYKTSLIINIINFLFRWGSLTLFFYLEMNMNSAESKELILSYKMIGMCVWGGYVKRKGIDHHTLNLEATEENLYDDLEDSSGRRGKRLHTKEHLEEANRLQCSTTT